MHERDLQKTEEISFLLLDNSLVFIDFEDFKDGNIIRQARTFLFLEKADGDQ